MAQEGCKSCLVGADRVYSFPVEPLTGEYFQWLREITDDQLRQHLKPATPEELTKFIEARAQHILDHLDSKTDPHDVCMPPQFIEAVNQDDKRHWQVDYDYFHRLVVVFEGHPFTPSDLEERFAGAMKQS